MVILLFLMCLLGGTLHAFVFQRKYNRTKILILEDKILKAQKEYEKDLSDKRTELNKQLAAVQYQLKLMEKLDYFRPDDLRTEVEVRKALALEKRYNALWSKERKIKRALEELDS